jgi:hypothetical protein
MIVAMMVMMMLKMMITDVPPGMLTSDINDRLFGKIGRL